MIFDTPSSVFVLDRTSLRLFVPNEPVELCTFSNEAYRNIEIIDTKRFEDELRTFLEKHAKGMNVVLLLSDDIVFSQVVSATSKSDTTPKDTEETFLSLLPFDRAHVITSRVSQSNVTTLYATNESILYALDHVCKLCDWHISSIIPSHAIGLGEVITEEDIMQVRRADRKIMQQVNMLNSISDEITVQSKSNTRTVLLVILFLLSFLLAIMTLMNRDTAPARPSRPPVVKKITPQSISPTPYPTITKDKARLLILNGSGKYGEATLLKTMFVDAGYDQVETGNLEEIATRTALLFATRSAHLAEGEIKTILETRFKNLYLEMKEASPSFDIVIQTGKQ